MLSLYRAYTSPAGSGTAAFVEILGPNGFKGCCTNNEVLARFVRETQVLSSAPFDVNMRLVEAELDLHGDVRTSPSWTIQAGDHQLECTWLDLDVPLVGEPKSSCCFALAETIVKKINRLFYTGSYEPLRFKREPIAWQSDVSMANIPTPLYGMGACWVFAETLVAR